MKVILRSDIAGLGKRGDICDVKDGHARNFLLPGGPGHRGDTDGAVNQAASMRRGRDLRDAQDRDAAQDIAKALVAQDHHHSGEGRYRRPAVRLRHDRPTSPRRSRHRRAS